MPTTIKRAPEQVREDSWESRLIRLIEFNNEPDGPPSGSWVVEDVLTERRYVTPAPNISSRQYNEMEVLAYVTASGACDCCESSGGRVFTLDKSRADLCGSCYLKSCDTHEFPCCPLEIAGVATPNLKSAICRLRRPSPGPHKIIPRSTRDHPEIDWQGD